MSYNTSDNSTVIQTQLSSSISSYTVSSEPGVTYYITVRAVNAVGPGDISEYSIVNGEKAQKFDIHCYELIIQCHYFPYSCQPLQHKSQLLL